MTRVKRGVIKMKRRRNVLKAAKGYRFGRSTKEAAAKEAIRHANKYAFVHRKQKKRTNRGLWQTKISAMAVENGTSFSKLMGAMKKKGYDLDRKVLAHVAEHNPEAFVRIVKSVA